MEAENIGVVYKNKKQEEVLHFLVSKQFDKTIASLFSNKNNKGIYKNYLRKISTNSHKAGSNYDTLKD